MPERKSAASPSRRRGSSSQRASTSRAEIIEAALAIIRERGVDGLSMRLLSDKLGVALGATYTHVRSKHAILALVTEELYSQVEIPPTEGVDYVDWLRDLVMSFWDVLHEYPGMSGYIIRNFAELAPTEITEVSQSLLVGAGFTPEGATRVRRTLMIYSAGSLLTNLPEAVSPTPVTDPRVEFAEGLGIVLNGARIEHENEQNGTTSRRGRRARRA